MARRDKSQDARKTARKTRRAVTLSRWEDQASRTAAERTVVIFGVNRGGTTSVAGVAQRLGLYLGDDIRNNLEDRALRPNRSDQLMDTIAERNAAHPVWGWKFPNAQDYLAELMPALRNPRFILVTRDLTANALGMMARNDDKPMQALLATLKRTRLNVEFVRKAQRPTLFVSYEKIVLDPLEVSRDIARFLNLPADEQTLADAVEFVKPGKYQKTWEG